MYLLFSVLDYGHNMAHCLKLAAAAAAIFFFFKWCEQKQTLSPRSSMFSGILSAW